MVKREADFQAKEKEGGSEEARALVTQIAYGPFPIDDNRPFNDKKSRLTAKILWEKINHLERRIEQHNNDVDHPGPDSETGIHDLVPSDDMVRLCKMMAAAND